MPKRAVAVLARTFYGERYISLPMKHVIEHRDNYVSVEYRWRRGSIWESITISAAGDPISVAAGSHEEFITEHYWGYTKLRKSCSEYRVEHPRWKIWPAAKFALRANVNKLYGAEFEETLSATPVSAFIAEGSDVRVWRREELA